MKVKTNNSINYNNSKLLNITTIYMIFKYLDFRYFFISFAIGILYIYLTNDYKKQIIIYPNPNNVDKYTFVDKADNCFKYSLEETKCPTSSEQYKDVKIEY